MKYINIVLLGCMVVYSSFTSALDLSIETEGHSIRVGEGSVAIDVPGGKLKAGNKPADAGADASNSDDAADKLEAIVHAGASDIEFTNVRQRDLEVTLNGAGSITISGKVENLIATNNGSGNLELENLVVEKAIVKINASGSANINVRRILKAEVNGSGDVVYSGNPKTVQPKITGTGSVEKN